MALCVQTQQGQHGQAVPLGRPAGESGHGIGVGEAKQRRRRLPRIRHEKRVVVKNMVVERGQRETQEQRRRQKRADA